MREKIRELLTDVWDTVTYNLRRLCGELSPMKRFIVILITGSALAIANIYFVFISFYNMGKNNAKMEFFKLQHIETLRLQQTNESINILELQENDEQQSDDEHR